MIETHYADKLFMNMTPTNPVFIDILVNKNEVIQLLVEFTKWNSFFLIFNMLEITILFIFMNFFIIKISWMVTQSILSTRSCEFQIPLMATEMCSIQHYVIKFVNDLKQVCGFLRVLRFPPYHAYSMHYHAYSMHKFFSYL
jgi:hypothetical protein